MIHSIPFFRRSLWCGDVANVHVLRTLTSYQNIWPNFLRSLRTIRVSLSCMLLDFLHLKHTSYVLDSPFWLIDAFCVYNTVRTLLRIPPSNNHAENSEISAECLFSALITFKYVLFPLRRMDLSGSTSHPLARKCISFTNCIRVSANIWNIKYCSLSLA